MSMSRQLSRQLITTCAMVTSHTNATAERADLPSSRTLWSVHGQKQMLRLWCRLHEKLAKGAAAWLPPTGGGGLALLGDSITESWRGTEFGVRKPRAAGVPRVLRETLGARWPAPLVLGIAGDQTQHLLWRLQHGEAAGSWARTPETLSVLLIGTNNLGAGQRPSEAAAGVLAVASWLLRHTAGRVLVLATLPRGDAWRLRQLCPAPCRRKGAEEAVGRGGVRTRCVCDAARRPRRSFMPAVLRLNALVRPAVAALGGRAAFADCGGDFVAPPGDRSAVRLSLMPDAYAAPLKPQTAKFAPNRPLGGPGGAAPETHACAPLHGAGSIPMPVGIGSWRAAWLPPSTVSRLATTSDLEAVRCNIEARLKP